MDWRIYLRHKLFRTEQEVAWNDGKLVEENNKGIALFLSSFSDLLVSHE